MAGHKGQRWAVQARRSQDSNGSFSLFDVSDPRSLKAYIRSRAIQTEMGWLRSKQKIAHVNGSAVFFSHDLLWILSEFQSFNSQQQTAHLFQAFRNNSSYMKRLIGRISDLHLAQKKTTQEKKSGLPGFYRMKQVCRSRWKHLGTVTQRMTSKQEQKTPTKQQKS